MSPIADLLTQMRNAMAVGKATVFLPSSKMKAEICKILVANAYIKSFEVLTDEEQKDRKILKILLSYKENKNPAIKVLKMISKPGRRIYAKNDALPHVLNNVGMAVISTSQGVMSNHDARKKRLGGEILFEVY